MPWVSGTSGTRRSKQYAHPAAIIVLTPRRRVSKYLYGVEYAPRDFRLAWSRPPRADRHPRRSAPAALYHYDPPPASTAWHHVLCPDRRRVDRGGAGAFRSLSSTCGAIAGSAARWSAADRNGYSVDVQFPPVPEAASTFAHEVDLLYFFILAVCAFFAVLVSALVVDLRREVPPAPPGRGRRRHPRLDRRSSCCGRSSRSCSRW
jgi:hypothetical protein